jgi:proline iminopeptidase
VPDFLALILSLLLAASTPMQAGPRQGMIETPDGVHLFYEVRGHGPEILVAVHGGPGNSLTSIAPDFVPFEKDFTIVYYDQRGGGRSDLVVDPAKLSLDRHIADLEAVRARFGLAKMKMLGNSWGGLLIAAYAAAHPDRVDRMVMQDPAPPLRGQLDATHNEINARSHQRLTPEQRQRLGQLFDAEYRATAADPRAVCREWAMLVLPLLTAGSPTSPIKGDVCGGPDDALRVQQAQNERILGTLGDFDLRPGMEKMKAPVLIVRGEADYVPLEGARAWAASMPNARLLVIPGAGHVPQGEQPQIFFPAIIEFLKGGWPAAAQRVPPLAS